MLPVLPTETSIVALASSFDPATTKVIGCFAPEYKIIPPVPAPSVTLKLNGTTCAFYSEREVGSKFAKARAQADIVHGHSSASRFQFHLTRL